MSRYIPKGYEGKVYKTIQSFQDKGVTRPDLRYTLEGDPGVIGKALGNLMFRKLIEEREGKLYAK